MPGNTIALPTPVGHGVGRIDINDRYRDRLAAVGCNTAAAVLDLPGEVVSGHPDRHVVRVEVPGIGTCYLKRQHRVGWKERFRQWWDGFGWASLCSREATLISNLEAAGLPAPARIASGELSGRAFLLVAELAGMDLRRFLSDSCLSPRDRRHLAARFGRAIAEVHVAGFNTPDLTAKHVFVDPNAFTTTLIDWQNARRTPTCDPGSLAALHASLSDDLASTRDRLRFLRAYCRALGRTAVRFSTLARAISQDAHRLSHRRSIRDQRQPVGRGIDQRLVWLAGEAVCAVPDVAENWPTPAVAPPFYCDSLPDSEARIVLPDGRAAVLVRGRSVDSLGRMFSRLRGRSWRSPGVTVGRVLFHLQRYGIPAPQLFAFGQRVTGLATADWFALYEPPTGRLAAPSDLDSCLGVLANLHDAGCRPNLRGGNPFRVRDTGVSIGDPRRVRIVRRVHATDRRADRRDLTQILTASSPIP